MHLTSFVKEKDVREYFQTAFRKPNNPDVSSFLMVPPLAKNPSMVGSAFDYLARWMIRTINPHAIERNWVAEAAVARLPDEKLQKRAVEIVRKARSIFRQFLKNGNLSDDVIAAAVSLARLDAVFRTGGAYAELIDEPAQPDDISDLRSLVNSMPLDQFKAKEKCFLNPTFGHASKAMGGADADVIIDDLLLDIKVKKDSAIRVEDFHQVVGYYLLYEIGGIDGIFYQPRISRLGFYSARYRLLMVWPISELIGSVPVNDSIQWLRQRLGMDEQALKKSTRVKARGQSDAT